MGRWDITGNEKMKKILLVISTLVIGAVLTSFVANSRLVKQPEENNDYIFYKSVVAWTEATESTTLYIFYKEGNGVRKYYSSCGDDREARTCMLYVKKNVLYKSSACNDFRRNYEYVAYYGDYYFNCDGGLPYMVE